MNVEMEIILEYPSGPNLIAEIPETGGHFWTVVRERYG